MKTSVSWRMAMNARIGFTLQVTATPGFHSLYDWYSQMMWLFPCAPDEHEDETLMEKHVTHPLYPAVQSSMHARWSANQDAHLDAGYRVIQIVKPLTMRRWSEWKLANEKPLVQITNKNGQLVDLEWTEKQQAMLKAGSNATFHKVLPMRGGFIDGGWLVSHWHCEAPKIGSTSHYTGPIKGLSVFRSILRLSDDGEKHFCQWLLIQL